MQFWWEIAKDSVGRSLRTSDTLRDFRITTSTEPRPGGRGLSGGSGNRSAAKTGFNGAAPRRTRNAPARMRGMFVTPRFNGAAPRRTRNV